VHTGAIAFAVPPGFAAPLNNGVATSWADYHQPGSLTEADRLIALSSECTVAVRWHQKVPGRPQWRGPPGGCPHV